ncbi:Mss4-like protein [Phaeosphaeriaceae sp. PMI808]|nr:Mss4-like protein [Phaeosphaeriaceae sp. PMI808]
MTMSEPMPTKPTLPTFDPKNCQTYNASCHCETVKYDVLLSPPLPLWKVVSCDCSICSRNGYLIVYPERSQLRVKSGEEALKAYSFGKNRNLHKFCTQCGSSAFFDPRMKEFGEAPPDLIGVNVRSYNVPASHSLMCS